MAAAAAAALAALVGFAARVFATVEEDELDAAAIAAALARTGPEAGALPSV